MKTEVFNNFFSEEKKTVYKSFLSLGLIQATNYILPLITIPYIIRIVGTDKFGVISLVQALMNYMIIFSEYGFNLSATRDIAMHREDKNKISEIFSSVLLIKLVLFIITSIILTAIVLIIPKFNEESTIFYLGLGLVLGQVLMPIWFFQGMEEMKYLTILNVIAKVFFTILIFLLIKTPSDYIYVILFTAAGNILAGLIGIGIVLNKFKIAIVKPNFRNISFQLKEGWYIFLSNFSIISYNNSNIFILGLFADTSTIGYYSVAEKVTTAVRQLIGSFMGASYPYICNLSNKSHQKIKDFFRTTFIPFAFFILIVCISIFIFSDDIIYFLTGNYISEASLLLKILSFVPIIVVLDNPFYQILLAYNAKMGYMRILILASVVNIIFNFIFVSYLSAIGTSIAVILTEIFVTVGLILTLEIKYDKYSLLK